MNSDQLQADQTSGECLQARANFRRQLLTTASAVVLAASLACTAARADDGDNPYNRFTFEFGGGPQFYSGGDTTWLPTSSATIGAKTGWDLTGKATFEPAHSPWIFSVAVQYGRSARKHKGEFSTFTTFYSGTGYFSANADHREQHVIVDFEVGQDVGLGMLGMNGSSVLSGGLRYAHLEANTDVNVAFISNYGSLYKDSLREKRTFTGVGPIISWDASTPFFNNDGPFSLDWGVAGAVLFGTRSARVDGTFYYSTPVSAKRSKTATVPSFDAYAAISYHCADCGAKASLGYRVDSFFSVLDGGGPTEAHNIDRIFHGPYLSVSFQTND